MVDSTGASLGLKKWRQDPISRWTRPIENYRSIVHDIVVDDAKTIQVDRNGRKMEIELPKMPSPPLLNPNFPSFPGCHFLSMGSVPTLRHIMPDCGRVTGLLPLMVHRPRSLTSSNRISKIIRAGCYHDLFMRDSADTINYIVPVIGKFNHRGDVPTSI